MLPTFVRLDIIVREDTPDYLLTAVTVAEQGEVVGVECSFHYKNAEPGGVHGAILKPAALRQVAAQLVRLADLVEG